MSHMGKRWILHDRDGNPIYLTEERWHHILSGHPEMGEFEEHLKIALKRGRRRQEPLNPRKYRYAYLFDDLPEAHTHVVAMVLFGFDVNERGETIPNNFIATAFMKHIQTAGEKE